MNPRRKKIMAFLNELLTDYLECIKNIQELQQSTGNTYYMLNQERSRLHREILNRLGFKDEESYMRLKEIFACMDMVCRIYSECDEWKLRTRSDVKFMRRYLERFLTSAECYLFLEGKSVPFRELSSIKRYNNIGENKNV